MSVITALVVVSSLRLVPELVWLAFCFVVSERHQAEAPSLIMAAGHGSPARKSLRRDPGMYDSQLLGAGCRKAKTPDR